MVLKGLTITAGLRYESECVTLTSTWCFFSSKTQRWVISNHNSWFQSHKTLCCGIKWQGNKNPEIIGTRGGPWWIAAILRIYFDQTGTERVGRQDHTLTKPGTYSLFWYILNYFSWMDPLLGSMNHSNTSLAVLIITTQKIGKSSYRWELIKLQFHVFILQQYNLQQSASIFLKLQSMLKLNYISIGKS